MYFRYILQYNPTQEDAILHGQSDSSLRGNLIFISVSILFTSGLWRKDSALHNYIVITDNVLFVDIGNHTVYVVSAAAAGQIPLVHYDPRWSVRRHNNHGAQRALQKAEHAQNGVLGEEDLHTATA